MSNYKINLDHKVSSCKTYKITKILFTSKKKNKDIVHIKNKLVHIRILYGEFSISSLCFNNLYAALTEYRPPKR